MEPVAREQERPEHTVAHGMLMLCWQPPPASRSAPARSRAVADPDLTAME
jgi:hypothetical protein